MRRLTILCLLGTLPAPLLAQAPEEEPAAAVESAPAAQTAAGEAARPAEAAPRVQHVPLHEAYRGSAELLFRVHEPDRVGAIVVRLSRPDSNETVELHARRATDAYVARVPETWVKPPDFRYFVVERAADGREHPLFASREAPQRVRVIETEERAGELRRLRANAYKRSSIVLSGEGVDFGEHPPAPGAAPAPDRYYRLEAGYGYRFYGFIEDIALTLVRVRGETGARDDQGRALGVIDAGTDYGRATVTLLLTDSVRTRSSLLLGASQDGFEYGGSGELIFGDPLAEHVALGGEFLTRLGNTGFLRMGFNATESIPMGARVELTDFPLGSDAAVRLLYELGYRFSPGTEVMVRAGYQGRTSLAGGPAVGATVRYGF
jgi:hypothetical protein